MPTPGYKGMLGEHTSYLPRSKKNGDPVWSPHTTQGVRPHNVRDLIGTLGYHHVLKMVPQPFPWVIWP